MLTCIFLIKMQGASATQSFQNNLVKADFYKNVSGGIKITLYTNKQYKDAIVANKKGENQYVILMPETSHSTDVKPYISSVSDLIKKVDVKTQQYDTNLKGYTKITIITSKPINIVPEVKTLNIPKNEKKTLFARSQSKQIQTINKYQTTKPKVQKTNLASPILDTQKNTKKITTSPVIMAYKQPSKKVAKEINPEKTNVSPSIEKAVKPLVQNPTQSGIDNGPKKVEQPKQPEQLQTVAKNELQTENPTQSLEKLTQKIKNGERFKKYKAILGSNFVIAMASCIGTILLVILFLLSNMNKRSKPRKHFETTIERSHRKRADSEANAEEILDDIFLGEDNDENYSLHENIEESEDFITTNMEQEYAESEFIDEQELINIEDIPQDNIIQGEESSDYQVDEVFGEEDNYNEEVSTEASLIEQEEITNEDYDPEQLIEEDEEEHEIIKSEYEIDEQKGFYLIDFEDNTTLVGHINDEIFILKRFEQKINAKLQVRLNESKGSSSQYIAKVGGFKGIIEVLPQHMSLLIEL